MYVIFFTLSCLFYFYTTGCNFTFFSVSYLIEACLFVGFVGGISVWFVKRTKQEKLLFFTFIFGCCFMFFIPFAQVIRIHFFQNLRNDFPVIYAYRWTIAMFLLCLIFYLLLKFIKIINFSQNFKKLLNFFAIVLFILSICNFSKIYGNKNHQSRNSECSTRADRNKYPNIYHIVLDSYVSCRYLSEAYGFDNTDFYKQLGNLGFWYDMDAKSNYSNTIPTFCSSFEMNYLNTDEYNEYDLQRRIYFNNKAIRSLKNKGGYQCYVNSPDVPTLESIEFDFRMKRSRLDFYYYLFLRTPLEFFLFKPFQKKHYGNILNQFHQMVSVKEAYGERGNYFLFHVICPHEPFIFAASGEQNSNLKSNTESMFRPDNNIKNRASEYLNQIKNLNALTLKVVKQILDSYDENNKPIIIIHGDHGLSVQPLSEINAWRANNLKPMDRAMLSILYAVYLPKSLEILPPPDGLVNLYRWLINSLFQEKMDYLPSNQIMRIDSCFIHNINI